MVFALQFAVMSAPGVLDIIVGHLSRPINAVKVRICYIGNPTQRPEVCNCYKPSVYVNPGDADGLRCVATPSGAAMQVVSAACAAVGALASANPGCQGELHARGATEALVALLAEHADSIGAEETAAAGDAAVPCSSPTAAATDSVAERAVWAIVELVAGNADLQDAVRSAHTPLRFISRLVLTSACHRAYEGLKCQLRVPRVCCVRCHIFELLAVSHVGQGSGRHRRPHTPAGRRPEQPDHRGRRGGRLQPRRRQLRAFRALAQRLTRSARSQALRVGVASSFKASA